MAKKRYDFATVVTSTGEVLAAGGQADGIVLRSCEMYDRESNSWYASASMLSQRAHFTLSLLDDGKVLAAGSWSSSTGAVDTVEVYCQSGDEWSSSEPMKVARGAHGAALLPDDTVLVIGGRTTDSVTSSTEFYTPATSEPEPPPQPPPGPCMEPIDILPYVALVAPEMPGHSAHGLIAKILVAQTYYEAGNIEDCLHILDAFYNQVRAFALGSGHMSEEGAQMLYDAYAEVVECLGGDPQPEIP